MGRAPRLSAQTVVVLEELLRAPAQQRYGYDLMKATALSAGTLYPILARLHDYGWLVAEWDAAGEAGRPPRHHYRLTPGGRAGAKDMIARAASAALQLRHA